MKRSEKKKYQFPFLSHRKLCQEWHEYLMMFIIILNRFRFTIRFEFHSWIWHYCWAWCVHVSSTEKLIRAILVRLKMEFFHHFLFLRSSMMMRTVDIQRINWSEMNSFIRKTFFFSLSAVLSANRIGNFSFIRLNKTFCWHLFNPKNHWKLKWKNSSWNLFKNKRREKSSTETQIVQIIVHFQFNAIFTRSFFILKFIQFENFSIKFNWKFKWGFMMMVFFVKIHIKFTSQVFRFHKWFRSIYFQFIIIFFQLFSQNWTKNFSRHKKRINFINPIYSLLVFVLRSSTHLTIVFLVSKMCILYKCSAAS